MILLYAFSVLLVLWLIFGYAIARRILYITPQTEENLLARDRERGAVDEAAVTRPYESLTERSRLDGVSLHARLYRPDVPGSRYLLFCHGYSANSLAVLKYLSLLLELGFTVLVPDHRHSGKSGGRTATLGVLELPDCTQWLTRLRQTAARDGAVSPTFSVMGESMGGALTLNLAALDPTLSLAVADCPFYSVAEICRDRVRHISPLLLPACPAALFFLFLHTRRPSETASALRAVKRLRIPTLLLHGDADTLVPVSHAHKLKEAAPQIELHVFPGARHCGCVWQHPAEYRRILTEFVERNLS